MDDDDGRIALDVPDLEEDRRRVRANDHREPVTQIPDPHRVPVGMQDLLFAQAVLQRRRSNDRILDHTHKLTCQSAVGKSRSAPTSYRLQASLQSLGKEER